MRILSCASTDGLLKQLFHKSIYFHVQRMAFLFRRPTLIMQSSQMRAFPTIIIGTKRQYTNGAIANKNVKYNHRELNKEILKIFDLSLSKDKVISKLETYVLENQHKFNTVNLSTLLQRSAKGKFALSQITIKSLATSFSASQEPFDVLSVGNSLYGLQLMSSDDPHVPRLLNALTSKVRSCREPLTYNVIGCSMFGLQKMSSSTPEVLELLRVLTEKISKSNDPFSAQAVGDSLFGLQCMHSTVAEVQELLSVLIVKVNGCKEPLNAQQVSNSFCGLRYMRCTVPEVRKLLIALVDKVDGCNETFGIRMICNIVYGLQNMNSDVAEVRLLLRALISKIANCQDSPNSESVCKALYALKNMSSDTVEVQQLIGVLIPHFKRCHKPFYSSDLSIAFYGLQHMTNDVTEVQDLLQLLLEKANSCQPSFNLQNLGSALYGLMQFHLDLSWKQLLSNMMTIIKNDLSTSKDIFRLEKFKGLVILKQTLSLIIGCNVGLRDTFISFDMMKELVEVNDLVDQAYLRSLKSNKLPHQGRSELSKAIQVLEHINKLFLDYPNIQIRSNEILHGFKAEIIINITNSDGSSSTVNVEIVGFPHKLREKTRFAELRNECLHSSHRIDVIHVHIQDDLSVVTDKLHNYTMIR